MSSSISSNLRSTIQQNLTPLSLRTLCKSQAILVLALFLFCTYLFNPPNYQPSDLLSTINQKWPTSIPIISTNNSTKTNISHILFGICGSMKTWKHRKSYIEAWWRPSVSKNIVADSIQTFTYNHGST